MLSSGVTQYVLCSLVGGNAAVGQGHAVCGCRNVCMCLA